MFFSSRFGRILMDQWLGFKGKHNGFMIYPLVMTNIAMENHHFYR